MSVPDGLTVPLRVAVAEPMFDGRPLDAAGGGGVAAVVVVGVEVVGVAALTVFFWVAAPPDGEPSPPVCVEVEAVVALVDAKPPLLVSHDAGRTWKGSGHGLPPGHAVAVSAESPDRVLYAARNRLYVSTDGARFWRALEAELPDIEGIAWED